MKQCTSCKKIKETSEFYLQLGVPKSPCKACRIELQKNIYRKNRDYYAKQKHSISKKTALKNKEFIDLFKEMCPCKDCLKYFPSFCMEFDHTSSDKTANISKLVYDGMSIYTIISEIKKTDLVCILCHRLRTFSRTTNKYNDRRQKKYDYILSKKNKPCEDCGVSYKPCQMDFDHTDPTTKRNNIAQMINHSTVSIDEEISKCKLLCALCHRKKTIKNKEYQING